MAQTLSEIRAKLAAAGLSPRHRLGQNFMIDGNILRLLVEAGRIEAGEVVIEVGPGTGSLTEELLARGANVTGVEIDRGLAELVRRTLGGDARLRLIEGDALDGKHALNSQLAEAIAAKLSAGRRAKLVANLPYGIASPLVIELLIAGCGLLAFTVQREVADRLRAAAGEEAYGPLSVMAGVLAEVEVLRTIAPGAFWPRPKVESAMVRMTRREKIAVEDVRGFGAFVHAVFGSRRKTLRKALEIAGARAEILGELGIDPMIRPEELGVEMFVSLWKRGHPS